jgi:hypothetical protein
MNEPRLHKIVDPALISIIPTETAHRLQVVPLYRIGDALTVAMADPDHIGALDELHHALGPIINPTLADTVEEESQNPSPKPQQAWPVDLPDLDNHRG